MRRLSRDRCGRPAVWVLVIVGAPLHDDRV
jgi:hypothetical protein